MSASPESLNIYIPRGSDWDRIITVYGQEVTCSIAAASGDTSVRIEPLDIALSDGAVIDWFLGENTIPYRTVCNGGATIGTDAGQAYKTVPLASVVRPIPKGTVGRVATNISANTYEAECRTDFESATDEELIFTFSCTVLDDDTANTRGQLQVAVSEAITNTLTPTMASLEGLPSLSLWIRSSLPAIDPFEDTTHLKWDIDEIIATKRYQRLVGSVVVGGQVTVNE